MNHNPPSQATIKRMSIYLRYLNGLDADGVKLVSSNELANKLGLNSPQVRKDLTHLGTLGRKGVGRRGVGYSVKKLRDQIIKTLGLKSVKNIGIVGAAGRLGTALAMYSGFEKRNFKVAALFDINPNFIGFELPEIGIVESMDEINEIVKARNIEILVICVPVSAIKEVFEIVKETEVKAILNFAPFKLISTNDICVHNVDFTTELEALSYKIKIKELDMGN